MDEVDSLLRKHENTEKLVATQDEKVANLCEFGDTLIANSHNESDKIQDRVRAVCERRNKLNEELLKRKHKLEDSRKIAQFYQDVVEVQKKYIEQVFFSQALSLNFLNLSPCSKHGTLLNLLA